MQKGQLREYFLEACNDISKPLLPLGFKVTKKGQQLKMKPPNKDLTYEIYFQSSAYNIPSDITICPTLIVYSQKAKAYDINITENPNYDGLVWGSPLIKLTPKKINLNWNLAGKSREISIAEIIDGLFKYGIPIFKLFDEPNYAVKALCQKGTLFYNHMDKGGDSLGALTFMLLYGTKEEAEYYFNGYVNRCTYKKKIHYLYSSLKDLPVIDLNFSEFWEAILIKKAYVAGLKIWDL